ncbi:hypothetical protein [Archangium violaceum]|uniref:hypothetical protein n=1 Tax=Archangium violaceum TaxID=83451 RepID=UPI0013621AC4|nr:hypothetical protein [Archangium violaceum]
MTFPTPSKTLVLIHGVEEDWEEVADFVLDWAVDAARATAPTHAGLGRPAQRTKDGTKARHHNHSRAS